MIMNTQTKADIKALEKKKRKELFSTKMRKGNTKRFLAYFRP